ncbi:hypothetical protein BLNAU_4922 [Blattamonas nauphoetae]|uniref:Uncharacterized protein n=1 Tax=Blattamonas nauphoetae TaxID=2049346 RepID=A0ABQ9Y8L0_9EUKA|nr:hypothetical protein BLNAU_4922 [Blattamonas nauphoetae]
MACSFGFVVLNAAVFDCHIVNRPLSTQFIASLNDALRPDYLFHSRLLDISETHLDYLVEMRCATLSLYEKATHDVFEVCSAILSFCKAWDVCLGDTNSLILDEESSFIAIPRDRQFFIPTQSFVGA